MKEEFNQNDYIGEYRSVLTRYATGEEVANSIEEIIALRKIALDNKELKHNKRSKKWMKKNKD